MDGWMENVSGWWVMLMTFLKERLRYPYTPIFSLGVCFCRIKLSSFSTVSSQSSAAFLLSCPGSEPHLSNLLERPEQHSKFPLPLRKPSQNSQNTGRCQCELPFGAVWCSELLLLLLFYILNASIDSRERGREREGEKVREREREEHRCEGETSIGFLPYLT